MRNPNEYDDDAYAEASNELLNELPMMLDALWEAGGEPEDIVSLISHAFQNCESGDLPSLRLSLGISAMKYILLTFVELDGELMNHTRRDIERRVECVVEAELHGYAPGVPQVRVHPLLAAGAEFQAYAEMLTK